MHTTCWSWLIAVDNWKRRHRTGKLQKRKGVKGRFRHKGHLMSPTSNVLCFICWPVDTSSFLFAGPAFDFFAVLDPLHRWRWCVTFYRVYNGSILTYCFVQNYPFFFFSFSFQINRLLCCVCVVQDESSDSYERFTLRLTCPWMCRLCQHVIVSPLPQ